MKKFFFLIVLALGVSGLSAQTIHIGDLVLEKGIAFYVDSTGQHGWAVALEDVGKITWGQIEDTPLPNVTENNDAINDVYGYESTKTVFEALRLVEQSQWYDTCQNNLFVAVADKWHNQYVNDFRNTYSAFLVVDFDNGWYLPSAGQLVELHYNIQEVNKGIVAAGGKALRGDYWSATEYSAYHAWYMNAKDGVSTSYHFSYLGKIHQKNIRAVFNF